MTWNGIERNKLDYILTDLLPVEVSCLFTYKNFYKFLFENKKNDIKKIIEILNDAKYSNKRIFDNSDWSSVPLKYSIKKNGDSSRELSLLQPLSCLNIYLFIELYNEEILSYMKKNNCYSIRYHTLNTNLYHIKSKYKRSSYFSSISKNIGIGMIEQSGDFFHIRPYKSMNSFINSNKWEYLNRNYTYCARIDYKSCFDSIYSHAYKWILTPRVSQSKKNKNSSLLYAIDRVVQNINGSCSNGLVVGPEFSRMIAEILLQNIDVNVKNKLMESGLNQTINYDVFRFVDDIFIFTHKIDDLKIIINQFQESATKFKISLNELKSVDSPTPCLPKEWLSETRLISDKIKNFFNTSYKYKSIDSLDKGLVKNESIFVPRFVDELNILMSKYPTDTRTITSFLLSTFYNNISLKSKGYNLFSKSSKNKYKPILDICFKIYSFFPSFDNGRKLFSIIHYLNDELCFSEISVGKQHLSNLINKYDYIFLNYNIDDLVDWFPLLKEYGVTLNLQTENKIFEKLKRLNNPILFANYLIYATYNEKYLQVISDEISRIIKENLKNINCDSEKIFQDIEMWYIIIFHNCPYIEQTTIIEITNIILTVKNNITNQNPTDICKSMILEFLELKDCNNRKKTNSFFNWSITSFVKKIVFKTSRRTIFKNSSQNDFGVSI